MCWLSIRDLSSIFFKSFREQCCRGLDLFFNYIWLDNPCRVTNKSIQRRDRKMWNAHFFRCQSPDWNWIVRNKPVISITSFKMSPRLNTQHRIFIGFVNANNNDQSFNTIQTTEKKRICWSNEMRTECDERSDCYCDLHRKIYWLEQIWSNNRVGKKQRQKQTNLQSDVEIEAERET